MDVASLEHGLAFRGRLDCDSQTHFIFECEQSYFVFSCLRSDSEVNDGYFRQVDKRAVRYVRSRMAGQNGITVMDVLARAERTEHVPSSLEALSVLFILVVLGEAVIDREQAQHELSFSVRE